MFVSLSCSFTSLSPVFFSISEIPGHVECDQGLNPPIDKPRCHQFLPSFCHGSSSRPNWKLQQQKTSFILRRHAFKKNTKDTSKKRKVFKFNHSPFLSKSVAFLFFSSPRRFLENDPKKSSKTLGAPESTIQNPDQLHRVIGKNLRSTAHCRKRSKCWGSIKQTINHQYPPHIHIQHKSLNHFCCNFTICLLYFFYRTSHIYTQKKLRHVMP